MADSAGPAGPAERGAAARLIDRSFAGRRPAGRGTGWARCCAGATREAVRDTPGLEGVGVDMRETLSAAFAEVESVGAGGVVTART